MKNIIREHVSEEVAADVRLLLRDLMKMVKVLTIYPPDNPLPMKMRGSFTARFTDVVNRFGGLIFSIRPREIVYNKESVFTDRGPEETLAALFYNAGIIYLEFREGLPPDEMCTFLDMVKTYINDRSLDRDLVSLLWQEHLLCIKFKTVEDLALGEYDTDMLIREMYPDYDDDGPVFHFDVNQIILEDETGRATEVSPEAVEDARRMGVSLDTPPQIDNLIDQLRVSDASLEDGDKQEIMRIVEENRLVDPYRSAARVLIDALNFWEDLKPFSETVAICEKFLDQLLQRGAFAAAADFVHAARSRQQELGDNRTSLADRLADFIRRAGDSQRVARLTDIINQQEFVDTNAIEIYLESLGWESLVHITGMLGNLVSKSARLMVCDYLSRRGREHLHIIGTGVRDPKWFVVRNTVMILGRIGTDKALRFLEVTINHPDTRVRQETIWALANLKTNKAIDLLCRMLNDSDHGMRSSVLGHLGRLGGRTAFEAIRAIVHGPRFSRYPVDDQEQFLIIYSHLGGSEVTDALKSIINSMSLFNWGQRVRYRLAALKALAYNTSDEAERLILKYTCSRRRWLREAAVVALNRRRRIMHREGETGDA